MSTFEKIQIVIGCVQAAILFMTFKGAWYVGLKANEINDRLRVLQDYVAIVFVPDKTVIKLLNVGKINLYLWGFDMPGNTHHFDRPRLIPAGTNDSAYYWIGTPDIKQIQADKFDVRVYLTDEFGAKWITDGGGDITKTKISKDNGDVDATILKVWSYSTVKKDWSFT
jgi:hypothetical protein